MLIHDLAARLEKICDLTTELKVEPDFSHLYSLDNYMVDSERHEADAYFVADDFACFTLQSKDHRKLH